MRIRHRDNLCIYNTIPKTTTKNAIERDTLKNTIGKSKQNFKKYTNNSKEVRKKDNRAMKHSEEQNEKIKK